MEHRFFGTYFQQPKARKLYFSTRLFTGKKRLHDLGDNLKTISSITSDGTLLQTGQFKQEAAFYLFICLF